MANTYQPIDCNFYDILEAYATLRKVLEIVYVEESGTQKTVNTRIIDLFTKNKEEFMVLENGITFRLDYLVSVDGKLLSGMVC